MASVPGYITQLRAITRAEPQFLHLEELEVELYTNPSDRATVVMFGSFVETHLRSLLTKSMRTDLNSEDRQHLFEYNGALGSFSSKILLAYALKIIGPKTRFDLDLIRLLRNEFAHSRMVFSFETPEVIEVIKKFKIVDLPESTIPAGYVYRSSNREVANDLHHPKTRFIATCHSISYRMLVARDGPQAGDFVFENDNPVP